MNSTELHIDETLIYKEQQEVLGYVFEKIDLSAIVFIGGIADYINLRENYHLVINDIDIAYENEEDIADFIQEYGYTKYKNKFYKTLNNEVTVVEIPFGDKSVHFDFFKKDFKKIGINESFLLGKKVRHGSFDEMRNFHNKEIGNQTSTMQNEKYEWKRLYKHSIKASLYNAAFHEFFKNKGELPLRCALTR